MKQLNIAVLVTELKKRISSNFLPENSTGLEEQQIYGIMLAAIGVSKSTNFINVIESIIKESVNDKTISTAESAVAFVRSKNKHNDLYQLRSDIVIEGINEDGLSRTQRSRRWWCSSARRARARAPSRRRSASAARWWC